MAVGLSKSKIVFFACVGWIAGLTLWVYGLGFIYVACFSAFGMCTGLFLYFLGERKTEAAGMIVCAVCVAVGFVYAHAWGNGEYERVPFGETILVEGTVRSYPKTSEFGKGFVLQTVYGNLQIYIPFAQEAEYGDIFLLRGTAEEMTDSQTYLKKNLVRGIIKNPVVLGSQKGNFSVLRMLYGIRTKARDILLKIFPRDEASLAVGVLIGGGSVSFSDEFTSAMQNSGTTHIVALSGYNISILIFWLYILLGARMKRTVTFWATTCIVALFVLMTGAEASIVRAAVMGMLIIVAQHAGRVHNFRQSVAIVAGVMLIQNPYSIRYDIGFLLSFLSLFGIVYVTPVFASLIKKLPFASSSFAKAACDTLGAQIAVLPVLALSFGAVSLISIPANILILPVVPAVMGLSFVTILAGIISFPAAQTLSLVAEPVLSYVTEIIRACGTVQRVSASGSVVFACAYYGVLFVILLYARKKLNINESEIVC